MPSKRTPWNKLPPLPARPCEWCSRTFVPDRANMKTARYCSVECRLAGLHEHNKTAQRRRVAATCGTCGKLMEVTAWRLKNKANVYCSEACNLAARRVTGENHPLYKPKVRMTCEVCGTVRMVKPSLVSRFRACSRRCAAALGQEAKPRTSSLEIAVAAELDRIGERYEAQRRFHWYVVDFYLPHRNLIIEADGSYWHSLPNMQRIDKSKNSYFRNHGFAIERLPEEAIRTDVQSAVATALRLHPEVLRG